MSIIAEIHCTIPYYVDYETKSIGYNDLYTIKLLSASGAIQ